MRMGNTGIRSRDEKKLIPNPKTKLTTHPGYSS